MKNNKTNPIKALSKCLLSGLMVISLNDAYSAAVSNTQTLCFEDRLGSISDWDVNDFCMECNMLYDDTSGVGDITATCNPLTAGSSDRFNLIVNPALGSGSASFTHHKNESNVESTSGAYTSLGDKNSLFQSVDSWMVNVGGENNDPNAFVVTFDDNHGLSSGFSAADLFALYNERQSYLISNQVVGAVVVVTNAGAAIPEEYVDFYDAFELSGSGVSATCNPADDSFDVSTGSGCNMSSLASAISSVSVSGLSDSKVRKTPVDVSKKAVLKVAALDSVASSVASFSTTTSYTAGFSSGGSISSDASTFLGESSGGLSGYGLRKQRKLCHLFGVSCGSPAPSGSGDPILHPPVLAPVMVESASGFTIKALVQNVYLDNTGSGYNATVLPIGVSSGTQMYNRLLRLNTTASSCPAPSDLGPSDVSNSSWASASDAMNLMMSAQISLTEMSVSDEWFHTAYAAEYSSSSGSVTLEPYFSYGSSPSYAEENSSNFSTASGSGMDGVNGGLMRQTDGACSGAFGFDESSCLTNGGSWTDGALVDYTYFDGRDITDYEIDQIPYISVTESECTDTYFGTWNSSTSTCSGAWGIPYQTGTYNLTNLNRDCFYNVITDSASSDIATVMQDSDTQQSLAVGVSYQVTVSLPTSGSCPDGAASNGFGDDQRCISVSNTDSDTSYSSSAIGGTNANLGFESRISIPVTMETP